MTQIYADSTDPFVSDVLRVNTVVNLRLTQVPTTRAMLITEGRDTAGDGLGHIYIWESESVEDDDGESVIQITGETVGRWIRIITGTASPETPLSGMGIIAKPLEKVGEVFDAVHLNGVRDIQIMGGYAVTASTVGSGQGDVSVWDITGNNPVRVGSCPSPAGLGGAYSLQLSGRYAFVTVSNSSRIAVIDWHDPSDPQVIALLTEPVELPQTRRSKISGRYLYITTTGDIVTHMGGALGIIDMSDPLHPAITFAKTGTEMGDAEWFNDCHEVDLDGGYLYTTSPSTNSIQCVDITDPSAPFVVSSLRRDDLFPQILSLAASEGYVYTIVPNTSLFQIIDYADPYNPVLRGSLIDPLFDGVVDPDDPELDFSGIRSVRKWGNYVSVLTQDADDSIIVIDVSDKDDPFVVGTVSIGGNGNLREHQVIGHRCFTVQPSGYIKVFNISGINVTNIETGNIKAERGHFQNLEVNESIKVKGAIRADRDIHARDLSAEKSVTAHTADIFNANVTGTLRVEGAFQPSGINTDTYDALVISGAPEAFWKFADTVCAVTAVDSSGNAHNSASVPGVTFGQPALQFDERTSASFSSASSSRVTVSDVAALRTGAGDATWVFTLKVDDDVTCGLYRKGPLGFANGMRIGLVDASTLRVEINGTFDEQFAVPFADGEVHRLTVLLDNGTNVRVRVDAADIDTVAIGAVTLSATDTIAIGANTTTGTQPFDGWLGKVALYTRLITDEEDLNQYNAQRGNLDIYSKSEVDLLIAGLNGSKTFNPASIAAGATETTTVTVTGAVAGDFAIASFSDVATANADKVQLAAKVSAADTVSVTFTNTHSAAVDLASGTLRARVLEA